MAYRKLNPAWKLGSSGIGAKKRLRIWRPGLKRAGKRPEGMREKVQLADGTWHYRGTR